MATAQLVEPPEGQFKDVVKSKDLAENLGRPTTSSADLFGTYITRLCLLVKLRSVVSSLSAGEISPIGGPYLHH